MSTCRFMFSNFITGPQALGVSSARPGMVGSPAAEALGSATCLAAGEHTGSLDQVLVVEIDSVEVGTEVGLATFRWKRESAGAWEAGGVPTSVNLTPLADGVRVKWVPGPGQEFYKGDRWSILAAGCQGPQALMDRDRDTAWRSLETAGQFIDADLGQAQAVRAVVLADHNLGAGAAARLKARDTLHQPVWSFDPDGGPADSLGQALANGRTTPRTYVDHGVLGYAEAGESCLEDGMLSLEPAAANLLAFSEDFTAWDQGRVAAVAGETAAPDTALGANKLREDSSAATHYLSRTLTTGIADDSEATLSVFARAGERNWLQLQLRTKDGWAQTAFFDLAAGAVTAGSAARLGMVPLGGGWHRCWVSGNVSSGYSYVQAQFYVAAAHDVISYQGDGASGLYLWGAQLEAGTTPTAYCPNRGRNRLVWSGALGASAWTLGEAAVLSDQGDGSFRLQLPAAGGAHLAQAGALKAGAQHTLSLEARALDGGSQFQLELRDDDGEHLSEVFSATSQWRRFSFTYTVGAVGSDNYVYINNGGGSYASDLLIRRAQLELAGTASGYAATGEPGLRGADAASFPLPPAARAAMSQEGRGCLALEWSPGLDHGDFPLDAAQGLVSTSGEPGSAFAPLYLYQDSAGASLCAQDQTGGQRAEAGLDFVGNQTYALALRWASNGYFQVGCAGQWGAAKPYGGGFNLEAGAIKLGLDPVMPMRLGRVKIWEQWLDQEPREALDPWEYPAHSQALAITRPHLTCFLERTHRHWRLELDDPDNPEGMLRAGLIYLGGCFEPQRTFRAGYGQGSVATRTLLTGGGGKPAGSSGAVAAYYQLEFTRLDQADAAGFEEMLAAVHGGGQGGLRPLFFTPFTDDPGRTLYCLPGAELARQQAPGGRWSLALRLEEVIKSDV